MSINILMPALSPTMEEGTLTAWHVKEGDKVAPGDVIAEIETDKATMEVEAVDEGTIGKILIDAGSDAIAVNTPIAILLEEGETEVTAPPEPVETGAEPGDTKAEKEPEESAPPEPAPTKSQHSKSEQRATGDRLRASPLARRLAAEAGLDLASIPGSGPHGRVVKADIEQAKASGAVATAPDKATAQPSGKSDARALADQLGMAFEAVPHSGVRKTIARRLLEASQGAPEFFLTIDCEIDRLLAARKRLNADPDTKISVNDFIIKACALALKRHPQVNAAWSDEAVLTFSDIDISMAVATPNGLITPIIKQADAKGLAAIAEEARELAARARDGKLKPEEYQGGTFSVSNLGMFGIKHFTSILNPPQACILAVGAGEQRAIVQDGQIGVATVMTVTLTCDHRVVDGAVGAQFLQTFKRFIEDPVTMLV